MEDRTVTFGFKSLVFSLELPTNNVNSSIIVFCIMSKINRF